jgi:hypothetical protein
MWAFGWRRAVGGKPHSPKGRAAARGLDARRSLQHAFMRAGDASPKKRRPIKNTLDSDHGIYRDRPWTARR